MRANLEYFSIFPPIKGFGGVWICKISAFNSLQMRSDWLVFHNFPFWGRAGMWCVRSLWHRTEKPKLSGTLCLHDLTISMEWSDVESRIYFHKSNALLSMQRGDQLQVLWSMPSAVPMYIVNISINSKISFIAMGQFVLDARLGLSDWRDVSNRNADESKSLGIFTLFLTRAEINSTFYSYPAPGIVFWLGQSIPPQDF